MIRPRRDLVWWLLAGALALPGAWQLGHGAWIYAKAVLAQHLLHSAWQHTLAQRAVSSQPRILPWPWADTWPVARLQVPRLDVDLVVL
ncbi:MAG: class GN sortase, partial [Pseudomonadota bacterium]